MSTHIFQTYSVVVGWNWSVVSKSVDVNFSEVEALLEVEPNAVVDSSVVAISVSQIYTCAHYTLPYNLWFWLISAKLRSKCILKILPDT